MHHLALAGLLILPSAALPPSTQGEIRLADVPHAVLAAHPELAGASVDLPMVIPAREPAPVLEAGPVEHWPAGALQTVHVRVHCASEAVCRPFYATVHLQGTAQAELPARPVQALDALPSGALRPGAHAAMLIDSGRIHLRIPVTCLSGGAPGTPIRVAGSRNARIYQAKVVDSATVRGEL